MPLMFVLTLFGWLLFRCADLAAFFACVEALTRWPAEAWPKLQGPATWLAVHIAPLLVLQYASRRKRDESELDHRPWALRGLDYSVMFLLVSTCAVIDVEFIYFQF